MAGHGHPCKAIEWCICEANTRSGSRRRHSWRTVWRVTPNTLHALLFFWYSNKYKKKLGLELSKSAIKRIYRYFILILKNPPTITKRLKSALITSNYSWRRQDSSYLTPLQQGGIPWVRWNYCKRESTRRRVHETADLFENVLSKRARLIIFSNLLELSCYRVGTYFFFF